MSSMECFRGGLEMAGIWKIFKNHRLWALASVAQFDQRGSVGWSIVPLTERSWFQFPSGSMPGLWVWFPVGVCAEGNRLISLTWMFLTLCLSLPLSLELKKISYLLKYFQKDKKVAESMEKFCLFFTRLPLMTTTCISMVPWSKPRH